jgi:hypothetical protein
LKGLFIPTPLEQNQHLKGTAHFKNHPLSNTNEDKTSYIDETVVPDEDEEFRMMDPTS